MLLKFSKIFNILNYKSFSICINEQKLIINGLFITEFIQFQEKIFKINCINLLINKSVFILFYTILKFY